MIVFRLAKEKYCLSLSGKGAEKSGGRWNSRGTAIVYTSDSRALCTTEIAVHLPLGLMPENYNIVTIEIPDSVAITEIKLDQLPVNWNSIPHPGSTQIIGDKFVKQNKNAVLKVPSAVVPGDFNYLLNPNHIDFDKITILNSADFGFDERLFLK